MLHLEPKTIIKAYLAYSLGSVISIHREILAESVHCGKAFICNATLSIEMYGSGFIEI